MIVVAGEALVDLVIDPHGGVTAALGGAPFNSARALGRLGADVEFVGAISTDRFGTLLATQLVDDGVGVQHVTRVDLPTTLAAAELDAGGAAAYRFYLDGTSAAALDRAPPVRRVLVTGGLGLVLEPMASTIEAMIGDGPAMLMIDVNCRPKAVADHGRYVARLRRVIAQADVVKVSADDAGYLDPGRDALAVAADLLALGPGAVLVTAGEAGVRALTADGVVEVAVDRVQVVDTVGAGDTFDAGFLAWWIEAGLGVADLADLGHVEAAARAACAAAAITCSRHGADPPWRAELPADWSP